MRHRQRQPAQDDSHRRAGREDRRQGDARVGQRAYAERGEASMIRTISLTRSFTT
jgi:hypothetical protein